VHLVTISSLHDVVNGAWILDSRAARHTVW
jgi:hypothetical protein